MREHAVDDHENHTAADCREESCRTIDGARKHGRENHQQNGIEQSPLRQ